MSLAISEDVKFDVEKKQLRYTGEEIVKYA